MAKIKFIATEGSIDAMYDKKLQELLRNNPIVEYMRGPYKWADKEIGKDLPEWKKFVMAHTRIRIVRQHLLKEYYLEIQITDPFHKKALLKKNGEVISEHEFVLEIEEVQPFGGIIAYPGMPTQYAEAFCHVCETPMGLLEEKDGKKYFRCPQCGAKTIKEVEQSK
jgi:predicted RNA-binding Zn-ribbon protein involved in translation (DUF1610 family)